MTPPELAVYVVAGVTVTVMTLLHSDPLTGRSLLDGLRDSWNQRRDNDA